MSKLYVFGIGGTGSRVLRSLTMMMAAGIKMEFDEIVPIIIDPDVANADLTRTVDLINNYQRIKKYLSFPDSNKNLFFRKEISQIPVNYTLRINDADDRTFQNFIGLPTMCRENQALTRMLFSQKNLTSHMDVGFKGNPNIGSVVLNQIANSSDFEKFASSFESGDKIFIVSSIFGGTGASGFPLLLKTLRTGESFSNYDIIHNAEIGAITILPYFKLEPDKASEIDSTTFISKAKSALAYYENNISRNNEINALYYLADDITNTYENHEGGSAQQNDAHLIEFLAATAIVDFSNKDHPGTVNKELGIKDVLGTVSFSSFHNGLNDMVRHPLTQFTLMANCFASQFDFIRSKKLNANNRFGADFYQGTFVNSLRDFLSKYSEWLEEMKKNKRSLDLFNLQCGNKPFEVINGVKAKKIVSIKFNYDFFFIRLNSAVKKCSGDNPNALLEMYYLATDRLAKEKFNY